MITSLSAASASSRLALRSSRALSTSARLQAPPAHGFFQRPADVPQPTTAAVATRKPKVAVPHTPPHVPKEQAPNYPTTWSETQNPRELAMRGPRFEQMDMEMQPQPLSAMEMIQREPIRLTPNRVQSCDGGELQAVQAVHAVDAPERAYKDCPPTGTRREHHHLTHKPFSPHPFSYIRRINTPYHTHPYTTQLQATAPSDTPRYSSTS